jgi:tetratricopeptide (TPR) repeat protein
VTGILSARQFLAGVFLLLAVAGCASLPPQTQAIKASPPAGLPTRAELTGVPFFPEQDNQCGPATLAMALNAIGTSVSPEALRKEVYLPDRKGSLQVEMLAGARRHGMIALELAPRLEDVLREVSAGTPVVVLQNLGLEALPLWHYALVVGYDLGRGELVLRSGLERRQKLPFGLFENTWRQSGYWAMVAVPPDRIPKTATESGYAAAAAALERIGQTRAAKTAYTTLLARWPDSVVGWFGLGNTAYALGELRQAETAFRKATEVRPDSAEAYNNLAQALMDQGRLGEALQAARQAVRLDGPFLATSRATLDEVLRKQKKPAGPVPAR